jgi:ribonuclease HI
MVDKKEWDGVTLFVDASYDSITQRSGWGAWYRHASMERGEIFGGQLATRCNHSNESELLAIADAVEHLHKLQMLPTGRSLIIQCDNIRAVGLILYLNNVDVQEASRSHNSDSHIPELKGVSKTPNEIKGITKLEAALQYNNTKVFVRHIKGHNGSIHGRSWVNEQCDREAKRQLKLAKAKGF